MSMNCFYKGLFKEDHISGSHIIENPSFPDTLPGNAADHVGQGHHLEPQVCAWVYELLLAVQLAHCSRHHHPSPISLKLF